MPSLLFSHRNKNLAICAWIAVLCNVCLSCGAAQTTMVPESVRIVWSDSTRELFTYTLRPDQPNRVKVQLMASGKAVGTRTAELYGGIETLLTLAEQASKEVADKNRDTSESKAPNKRRLTIIFVKEEREQSFSVEGDIEELTLLFRSTVPLREILKLVSEGQPKAYRLIDEDGPLKQMMQPPSQL